MEIETKTNGGEKEKNRSQKQQTEKEREKGRKEVRTRGREEGRKRKKKLAGDYAVRFQWTKHARKCAHGWQEEERGKKPYAFVVCLSPFLSPGNNR